jgi:hypothetical protein
MKAMFNGVEIQLTPEQIKVVTAAKEKHEKAVDGGFIKVLKSYGFEKMSSKGWANPDSVCFQHPTHGWFAEIIDHGLWQNVWMVGTGLRNSQLFPGGWSYDEPQVLHEELSKATTDLLLSELFR